MKWLIITFTSLALFACSMAPKYKTPKSPVRLAESNPEDLKVSLTNWKNFFPNSDVQRLINLGLKNNRDLKIAQINIGLAKAGYDISKYNFLPTIQAGASMSRSKLPSSVASFQAQKRYDTNLLLTAFELDFFGRLNSLKNSAQQEMMASIQGSKIVEISLIAQIASDYTKFIIDKDILENSNMILDASEEMFIIAQAKYDNMILDKSDLFLAKESLNQSKILAEQDQLILEENKNKLMEIIGVFDEDQYLPKDNVTSDIIVLDSAIRLTPSESLLSRPDIIKAEHELKAMNANIGAARAAFFPRISLTGNLGYASKDLSNLFLASNWNYTPQIRLPLFPIGNTLANLEIANIRKEAAIINYERSIQTAFKEVSDLLAIKKTINAQVELSSENLKIQKEIYDLTKKKFSAGIISKDKLLSSRIDYLLAKNQTLELEKLQIINKINLFKALGGV